MYFADRSTLVLLKSGLLYQSKHVSYSFCAYINLFENGLRVWDDHTFPSYILISGTVAHT